VFTVRSGLMPKKQLSQRWLCLFFGARWGGMSVAHRTLISARFAVSIKRRRHLWTAWPVPVVHQCLCQHDSCAEIGFNPRPVHVRFVTREVLFLYLPRSMPVSPCQYHSTIAPYWYFIHLPPMLYEISNYCVVSLNSSVSWEDEAKLRAFWL
jgi:hypothetical protein